jgi:hypothetical protein
VAVTLILVPLVSGATPLWSAGGMRGAFGALIA